MRVVRDIDLNGRTIQVRELTVGEIRAWLKDSGAVSGDVVDATLFEDYSLPDLTRMSSLSAADIAELAPSELRSVFDAAREVNADFFLMRSRVLALGRAALQEA
jgi:hypothetical protein